MISYWYVLLLPFLYIVLFLLYTLIKYAFPRTEKIIFCTVCASYFTVLVISIIFRFNPIIIALLAGMSITGIAHAIDGYLYEKKKMELPAQQFVIQLALTIIGIAVIMIIA